MLDRIDTYTFKARLLPAIIVILPIGMAFFAWFPFGNQAFGLLNTGIISFALGWFLSQLSRGPGKRIQEKLYKNWGGMPSILMLAFSYSTLPTESLKRYHAQLNNLIPELNLPMSLEDEKRMSIKAMQLYESASDWIRNSTRDKERFRLIFAENVNYGFRRNLLGLKPIGILTWLIGFLVTSIRALSPILDWRFPSEFSLLSSIYAIVCLLVLLIWLFRIDSEWVRETANEYAKQLIEAVDLL